LAWDACNLGGQFSGGAIQLLANMFYFQQHIPQVDLRRKAPGRKILIG
jgi:hypothetical protein